MLLTFHSRRFMEAMLVYFSFHADGMTPQYVFRACLDDGRNLFGRVDGSKNLHQHLLVRVNNAVFISQRFVKGQRWQRAWVHVTKID